MTSAKRVPSLPDIPTLQDETVQKRVADLGASTMPLSQAGQYAD